MPREKKVYSCLTDQIIEVLWGAISEALEGKQWCYDWSYGWSNYHDVAPNINYAPVINEKMPQHF